MTLDRGLHNRGTFARGVQANGAHIRRAGVETPEQNGRGERHGGILKQTMERIIRYHRVIGKDKMKMAAVATLEVTNADVSKGGPAPAQWVLGACPSVLGNMNEEEEWGQLGVVQDRMNADTEFGLKAQCRLTAKKCFVNQDCGRRL